MATAGVEVPLRFLRAAIKKGISVLRSKIAASDTAVSRKIIAELQPIYAHVQAPRRPIERIKVAKRWYSTHYRKLLNSAGTKASPAVDSAYRATRVGSAVGRITTTSPFATTLRPSFGGGAFPRTASGYSLGNGGPAGARFFSHSTVAPAQVISEVSSAMRAFLLSGKNGIPDRRKTHKSNLGVRAQLAASLVQNSTAPGAYVDFHMAPTFTSLSKVSRSSMETPGLMAALTGDFAMAVKDITAVLADIKRLATLGDLPISLAKDKEDTIRVHFGGCDREFVERLCDELGVRRGVVGEDQRFGFELLMPLLEMPNVPTYAQSQPMMNQAGLNWEDMLSDSSGTQSQDGELLTDPDSVYTPGNSSSDLFSRSILDVGEERWSPGESTSSGFSSPLPVIDLAGLQDVHRFLEQIDEYPTQRQIWG